MMFLSLDKRTKNVPSTEPRIQSAPIKSGKTIICSTAEGANALNAISIVATTVTAYVSNKSAAIPAQSPTLSPTLSAITAALRGSSSGIPASTLPTKSAPTSAPLVKIPPPRRAKIEIKDAPKPSATSASRILRKISIRSSPSAASKPRSNCK